MCKDSTCGGYSNNNSNNSCSSRLEFCANGCTLNPTLDGIPQFPINLGPIIKNCETLTRYGFDQDKCSTYHVNEDGEKEYVSAKTIVGCTNHRDHADVCDDPYDDCGIGVSCNGKINYKKPVALKDGETVEGFLVKTKNGCDDSDCPDDGTGCQDSACYRLMQNDTTSCSTMVNIPGVGPKFCEPMENTKIAKNCLANNGTGFLTPAVTGNEQIAELFKMCDPIENTDCCPVEVTIDAKYSACIVGPAGTRVVAEISALASLVNGGADFQTTFINGLANDLVQLGHPEGTYPNAPFNFLTGSGQGQFKLILQPGQKFQLKVDQFVKVYEGVVTQFATTIGGSAPTSVSAGGFIVIEPTIHFRRLA